MKKLDYRQVYRDSSALFGKHGFANPGLLAKYVISEVTGKQETDFFIQKAGIPAKKAAIISDIINERLTGRPFEYIFKHKFFFGYDFKITPDVMIPRYETELLCSLVINDLKQRLPLLKETLIMHDFFTGSGIIPVTVFMETAGYFTSGPPDAIPGINISEKLSITGFDISLKALSIARENSTIHRAPVRFYAADCTGIDILAFCKADILTANPPYIRTDAIAGDLLSEPRLALDGGKDGLNCYRKFLPLAYRMLKPKGSLYMEIGYDQHIPLMKLAEKTGFKKREIFKDMSGFPRIIRADK